MLSKWPEYQQVWQFAAEEAVIDKVKEAVRSVRNLRSAMDVPPSRKAHMYLVCEDSTDAAAFESQKEICMALMGASHIQVQADKSGIAEDAVSAVTAAAVVYIPLEDLVDLEKERERLTKEKEKLARELARSNGMLSNEKFISKAPQAKIDEERKKLAKYQQMMEQVSQRLAQLG